MLLSWDEVEPLAKATFNIWVDQPELAWAKEAWSKVSEAGLAEYETQADRCRVFARFMVLASFYRDWCAVARDERQDDEVVYWIDAFDYDPLHLGQAVGSGAEVEDEADAFAILIDEERKSVVTAVIGGYESESHLFVALWRSSRTSDSDSFDYDGDEDQDEDEHDDHAGETDYEILNSLDEDKMAGFAWISDGCENLGPVRFRGDD
jgi:hypothetical protein